MLLFFEKFVLVILAGCALFILGSNPLSFDLWQRISSILVLTALALLVSAHIQTKSGKKKSKQLKQIGWSALALLLVSSSWFAAHTVTILKSGPTAATTRPSKTPSR